MAGAGGGSRAAHAISQARKRKRTPAGQAGDEGEAVGEAGETAGEAEGEVEAMVTACMGGWRARLARRRRQTDGARGRGAIRDGRDWSRACWVGGWAWDKRRGWIRDETGAAVEVKSLV